MTTVKQITKSKAYTQTTTNHRNHKTISAAIQKTN